MQERNFIFSPVGSHVGQPHEHPSWEESGVINVSPESVTLGRVSRGTDSWSSSTCSPAYPVEPSQMLQF